MTAPNNNLATRQWAWPTLAALVLATVMVGTRFAARVPESVQLPLREAVDRVDDWLRDASGTHPVFTVVLDPFSSIMSAILAEVYAWLVLLGWPGLILFTAVLAWRLAGPRTAAVPVAALSIIGLLGSWDSAMRTLALMLVAVALAVLIGIPLGIASGRNRRVEMALRPILDAMQTTPAYVYLLPMVVLFSVGDTAALVATVIFAVPPVARLTSLGISQVDADFIAVGVSSGVTRRQLLRTVELPIALPSIRVGINQTIMMALSMAVIGGLIGGTGLGREVFRGLQTLNVGRALDAGLAVVFIAIFLDRMTSASNSRRPRPTDIRNSVHTAGLFVASLVVGVLLGSQNFAATFPFAGALSVERLANNIQDPINSFLYPLTSAFSTAVLEIGLNPLTAALSAVPWWLLTVIVAALAWRVGGPLLGAYAGFALTTIAMIGIWGATVSTTIQVFIAVLLSVAIAIPAGVACALSNRLDRWSRPVLDAMQTLPQFVYLVPVVFLFDIGRVSGVAASVVFALPPAIRITNSAIRQVPEEAIEAARSAGTTRWQLLRTVQLPLARRGILLGVNQTTMMALAGVVIAGLIGSGGLGIETVLGLTRGEIGRGVVGGVAIVLIAMLFDRITQAVAMAERTNQVKTAANV